MISKTLVGMVIPCLLALPVRATAQETEMTGPRIRSSDGSAPIGPSLAFRQFGAWLDDASTEGRGVGRVNVGAGYWRTTDGRQINAPMIDAGVDLSDRIHVSAFVPFYRATFGAESMAGLDDAYLNAKVIVLTGAQSGGRFGMAVSPVLEVLNGGFTSDRVHWALPVSIELRARRLRVYGATGYFSRGAIFGGAAMEWTAPTNSVTWASLTDSYALETGTDAPLAASDRHRVDLGVGIAHPLNGRLAAYGSIARTLSSLSSGGVSVGLSGGVSIRVPGAGARP
jgi:hypothetical protein